MGPSSSFSEVLYYINLDNLGHPIYLNSVKAASVITYPEHGHFRNNSWPPKSPKYFSVGIFEYILASMPNVCLNVLQYTLGWMPSLKMPQSPQNRSKVN